MRSSTHRAWLDGLQRIPNSPLWVDVRTSTAKPVGTRNNRQVAVTTKEQFLQEAPGSEHNAEIALRGVRYGEVCLRHMLAVSGDLAGSSGIGGLCFATATTYETP